MCRLEDLAEHRHLRALSVSGQGTRVLSFSSEEASE
eukprot:COSAG06_NODE_30133_length_544_cov_0.759551_1_plen_35_part_10